VHAGQIPQSGPCLHKPAGIMAGNIAKHTGSIEQTCLSCSNALLTILLPSTTSNWRLLKPRLIQRVLVIVANSHQWAAVVGFASSRQSRIQRCPPIELPIAK
jgi:hypothetical protein